MWLGTSPPPRSQIEGMRRRAVSFSAIVLGLGLLATPACKKESFVEPKACANEVAELRAWLAAVAAEGEVEPELVIDPDDPNHFLTRPLPRVPLVQVDEPPSRSGVGALLTLNARVVQHDKYSAPVDDEPSVRSIAKVTSSSVLSPEFGFGGLGRYHSFHPISALIGANERWADVVRVANAAIAHGVSSIYFVFAVPTKVARPSLDSPAASRMVEIATNAKERPWDRRLSLVQQLRNANVHCPDVAGPFADTPTTVQRSDEQLAEFFARASSAHQRCQCRGDVAAIRAFAWTRNGRHWGGPVTAHEVRVSPQEHIDANTGRAVEEIKAPKDATWQVAHRQIIDAAKRKALISFAVAP